MVQATRVVSRGSGGHASLMTGVTVNGTTTSGNALCVKDGHAKERKHRPQKVGVQLPINRMLNHGPIKTTTASMDTIGETDLEKAMCAIKIYQDVSRSLLLNFWKFG